MRSATLLLILAAGSATALGQTGPSATVSENPLQTLSPCRDQELSVRHVMDDAAMGGVRMISYAFKNKSSVACTLKGYPTYELLSKSGAVPPHGRARRSAAPPGEDASPPQMVTLEPGKEVGFRVDYNAGGAGYMGKPCPVTRRVRITAPGARRRFVLREEISLCNSLQVSAVSSEVLQ